MSELWLTPFEEGEPVELSRTLFRKKILPLGSIDYKGRRINFDKAYLTDLAKAYDDGAFDQVPFMLADRNNAHTMDPDRYRGECKGVQVAEDGLYGVFDLTSDAAELVRRNPKLGVSARIVEGYDRADGKKYGRAMQHVLGTLDPRVPGLGAWQEVSLSGYDGDAKVVNLTEATYEGEIVTEQQTEANDLEELTEEEARALLKAAGIDVDNIEFEEDDDTEEPVDEDEEEREPAMALSNEANERIAALEARLAEERWEKTRAAYITKGVPPAVVDLAKPVLAHHEEVTIDLSNDNTVSATEVVTKLLDKWVGFIDLANERGHTFASDEEVEGDDPDKGMLEAWDKQYPAV